LEKLSSPIDHANHNFKLCQLLSTSHPNFGDWVITTGHYAAIHFVSHKLFPGLYKIGGKEKNFVNFDEYYNAHKSYYRNFPHLTPHTVRAKLVNDHLIEIRHHYKDLKDECWTARYKNYEPKASSIKMAVEAINTIRAFCDEEFE
jgi:hypothetical protein